MDSLRERLIAAGVTLNPPVDLALLDRIEIVRGYKIPAEIRALYLISDGIGHVIENPYPDHLEHRHPQLNVFLQPIERHVVFTSDSTDCMSSYQCISGEDESNAKMEDLFLQVWDTYSPIQWIMITHPEIYGRAVWIDTDYGIHTVFSCVERLYDALLDDDKAGYWSSCKGSVGGRVDYPYRAGSFPGDAAAANACLRELKALEGVTEEGAWLRRWIYFSLAVDLMPLERSSELKVWVENPPYEPIGERGWTAEQQQQERELYWINRVRDSLIIRAQILGREI